MEHNPNPLLPSWVLREADSKRLIRGKGDQLTTMRPSYNTWGPPRCVLTQKHRYMPHLEDVQLALSGVALSSQGLLQRPEVLLLGACITGILRA